MILINNIILSHTSQMSAILPSPSTPSKNVVVITSNARKVADASAVFGICLPLESDDMDEIQNTPTRIAIDKVRKIHTKSGPCLGEDTSFGLPAAVYLAKNKEHIFPALIKHLIDACKVGGGELVVALNAISPGHTLYEYTSTVAFCDGVRVVLFQCIMTGTIRHGGGKGDIDPHFVPISFTLVRIEDGVSVTLVQDQMVDNPGQKTIGEQPDNRQNVHPRYFALRSSKSWLEENGYTIKGADSASP
jgi:Ham1 family